MICFQTALSAFWSSLEIERAGASPLGYDLRLKVPRSEDGVIATVSSSSIGESRLLVVVGGDIRSSLGTKFGSESTAKNVVTNVYSAVALSIKTSRIERSSASTGSF